MADTLESLEIEVKHSASGAESELAKVTAQIRSMGQAIAAVLPQLKQYADLLSKVGSKASAGAASAKANAKNPLTKDLQDMISTASKTDVLQAKLESLREAMNQAFASGDMDKAYALRGQILQTEAALRKANATAKDTAKGMGALSSAVKKTQSPLGNFIASLKRIAFYRIIRSIIKAITQAFSEGLKAAYTFSSGMAGESHRFAAAMDSMTAASFSMKAQLGSAFIALLAAIAPIINAIISLITALANALAQLFAAFTGGTYLKATASGAKFADTFKKSAGGAAAAAKEWKNQLLGFDEINKLEAPSDGGGGGGGGGGLLDGLFEDAEIGEKYKKIVEWLQEHFDLIRDIAIAIGVAIAAWKLAAFLSDLLGLQLGMKQLLGIAMTAAGIFLELQGITDAITNGVNWDNFIEMVGGAVLIIGGLALALGSVAAGIGALITGFALAGVAVYDWIQKGELTTQSFWLLEAGILAVGVGLSLLTGSWIPLAVAAVVGAVVGIITHWDKLIAKIKEFQGMLHEKLNNGKLDWEDFAAVAIRCLTAPIDSIITLVGWIQTAVEWITNLINAWNSAPVSEAASAAVAAGNAYSGGNYYASGGFPDEGQMFIAREAGPEMVGTIGGRTAVATNNDIVAAVAEGVYGAVASAMGNNSGGGGTSMAVFNVNGREFMRAVFEDGRAVANEHGVSLIAT